MTTNDNHKNSIQGVTLVEMGLICIILSAIIISVMLSLSNYSKNQALNNDAKLDKQSIEELIRAANNYFVVCNKYNSVNIVSLYKSYLAIPALSKEISWDGIITAQMSHDKLAKNFTVSATYIGDQKNRTRYAQLLEADKLPPTSNTFSWTRSVGHFKSYEVADTNLGPNMGNYIQLMNNAAHQQHATGAKQCQ